MAGLHSLFETDKNKEKGSGIILDYGKAGTVTIHRAGGGNREYKKKYQELLKTHGRAIDNGTMPEETSDKLYAELYADTVITAWDVKGKDGEPIPFDRESVVETLLELPEFFFDIRKAALDVALFRAQEVKEDMGK